MHPIPLPHACGSIPTALDQMLQDKDAEKSQCVMTALLQMGKLDIQRLRQAYEQS